MANGMQFSVMSGGVQASVTGAGTTTTDATVVDPGVVVSAGAANSGVRLRPSALGRTTVFSVSGANSIILYPPSGGTINGGSADAGLTVATKKSVLLVCTSSDGLTFWGPVGA